MKTIPLTQGKQAIIDDEDFDLVTQYNWYAHKTHGGNWYARTGCRSRDSMMMHHLLCGRGADHRNSNGLDNRRDNLRPATSAQNAQNRKPREGRYKGVTRATVGKQNRPGYVSPNPWKAHLLSNGRSLHLGYFRTPQGAARAYDRAALEHNREFARLNFPNPNMLGSAGGI